MLDFSNDLPFWFFYIEALNLMLRNCYICDIIVGTCDSEAM